MYARIITIFIGGFLLLLPLLQPVALAASPTGITVTPSMDSITIAETEPEKRLAVMITNNTDSAVALELTTQDFGALEDTGGLFFLGSKPDTSWDNHRLAAWMRVSPGTIHLKPREQQVVTALITDTDTLSPGGHYGAIVAKLTSSPSNTNLAINQAVSSLFFVNKQGGDVLGMSLQKLQVDIAWWGQPHEVTVSFANTGNTHVVPRGSVRLQDPFKKTIAQGTINQASTALLPNTKQTFTVHLGQSGLPWWPGTYTMRVDYRHDGSDTLKTATKQLFSPGIMGVAITVALIVGGIVWVVRRSRHNRG